MKQRSGSITRILEKRCWIGTEVDFCWWNRVNKPATGYDWLTWVKPKDLRGKHCTQATRRINGLEQPVDTATDVSAAPEDIILGQGTTDVLFNVTVIRIPALFISDGEHIGLGWQQAIRTCANRLAQHRSCLAKLLLSGVLPAAAGGYRSRFGFE